MFRELKADEIDVRVAQINQKGATLLLYKDARCDMNILDETVGAFNWKRSHTRDNANCVVSLWDESKNEWVSKEDTGTESFTEKEKGLASDSFKRACFNWGIGRELYTAPFIYVPESRMEIIPKGDKFITYDKFKVSDISYDEKRQITRLVIQNAKTDDVVYSFGNDVPRSTIKKKNDYICTDCGKSVDVAMAMRTEKAFGTMLCKECGIKRGEEKGEMNNEQSNS